MSLSFPFREGLRFPRSGIPFLVFSFLLLCIAWQVGDRGPVGQYPIVFRAGNEASAGFELPAGGFILSFIATGLLCILILSLLPKNISRGRQVFVLLAVSITARCFLLPQAPSDDVYRYLWEGRLIREGISPYRHAPQDPVLSGLADGDPFHPSINHPDLPAAYPPFALLLFSLAGGISYSTAAIKWLVILFDMGTLGLIVAMLRNRGLDVRWAFLYALNPVVLFGFSAHAHFDSMQNFFLMGAVLSHARKRWILMFLFAGLAVQSKYFAIAAVPFLLNQRNFRYAVLFPAVVAVPFLMVPDTRFLEFFASLQTFGQNYAFNGSIHGLFRALTGDIRSATLICKGLFAAVMLAGLMLFHPLWNRRFRGDPLPGMFFSLGALLLLLPTVHAWYLSWIIPFLCFGFSRAWLLLSISIAFYFVCYGIYYRTGQWHLPLWARTLEWIPFYLLLLWEGYLLLKRRQIPFFRAEARSLSVVIPVKNEEQSIARCLQAVFSDPAVTEAIVVDGGSTDQTAVLAVEAGASMVISHPNAPETGGGRGGQIHRGIREANGDIVAVVHADVLATAPVFSDMLSLLRNNPTVIGGAVGGIFGRQDFRLNIVEWLNDFRAFFFSISFGDQVQFFRRKPVVEQNTFPDIPLMEDVEFSIRLNQLGRTTYLFGNVMISDRRWRLLGVRNGWTVMKTTARYLIRRVFTRPDTMALYRHYYEEIRKYSIDPR